MACRMRKPETTRLEISQGDWLLVKKHLTAGEQRQMFDRMMRDGIAARQIDSTRARLARCLTYLLDWSVEGFDGKPVLILDQPEEVVAAALDALDPESFNEIADAIDKHAEAMEKARVAEKNARSGGTASSAISPSPSTTAGATNG